jgi:hypothetical protein
MKTKLAPKKQRQQFISKVAALLLDLGAEAPIIRSGVGTEMPS